MPDLPVPTNVMNNAEEIINQGMELVDLFVNKNYLINIDKCDPIPLPTAEKSFAPISLFQIDKIVYDPSENINDKLVSVYSALSNSGSAALLVISSNETGVDFYLGTRDSETPAVARAVLEKSLRGNFPGINIREKKAAEVSALLTKQLPQEYMAKAVTSVSVVPGMRDEDDKNGFVQGIEKFIDSMAGESYTAIFVSSPLSKKELEEKKRGFENLYSALSQCSEVVLTYGENESNSVAEGISKGFSQAVNEGISDTTGRNSGVNENYSRGKSSSWNHTFFGYGYSSGKSKGQSKGSFEGVSQGQTKSRSETTTNSDTTTTTKTSNREITGSIQLTRQNKTVQELLEKIDEQLERIKNCEAYGLWDSACYFVADREETAIVAANTFKALVAGEDTSVENSFVNVWDGSYEKKDSSLIIMDYLRYGLHPKFVYDASSAGKDYEDQEVTVASLISGVELPLMMGLPHKSVSGVTSIESAEFGRNVFRKGGEPLKKQINLGAVYHMGEVFLHNRVTLNLQTLTSHCFITGSTGSGKSNTTYKLIDEVTRPGNDVKFLVIEPAKGEYKLQFGSMPYLNIYTTNPKYYTMLCINPFEFNEEIHVLEHLDRLIEIFSACWPLYAAMPAVLKASFERAYIRHGWDLNHSTYCDMGNGKYPTFKDVVETLPGILNETEFSAETKGNYIGSLVTRVESLTNGLIGQIFNGVTLSDELLFNENSIVDLSRVGSTETKALIMGVLILKLSEFRQSTSLGANLPLKHITIMEEAHNLLKRVSTAQGQESSNVQGKAVEMISNSIAEMRTYGEGFIIVDQSPTAVDISAIKNTNTKIVMRLPDASDCEAVGHSMGLNDEQINELSRLDKGVAAVFQNDWLEAVLTKIDLSSNRFEIDVPDVNDYSSEKELVYLLLEELIMESQNKEYKKNWLLDVIKANSKGVQKASLTKYQSMISTFCESVGKEGRGDLLPKLIMDLMNCNDLFKMFEPDLPPGIRKSSNLSSAIVRQASNWKNKVYKGLDRYITFLDQDIKEKVFLNAILYQIHEGNKADQYKVVLYCNKKKMLR